MKTALAAMDIDRLNAARGLDLKRDLSASRPNQNMSGLKPSVGDYNKAIKTGIYTGRPITPIGEEDIFE